MVPEKSRQPARKFEKSSRQATAARNNEKSGGHALGKDRRAYAPREYAQCARCTREISGRLSCVGRVMPLKSSIPVGRQIALSRLVLGDTIILQLSYYILVMGRFYLLAGSLRSPWKRCLRPCAPPVYAHTCIFAHRYLYGGIKRVYRAI